MEDLLDTIKIAKWVLIEEIQGAPVAAEWLEVLSMTMQVDYNQRPGCDQVKLMACMQGPKEKLVLAHSEFFISSPKSKKDKFEELFKTVLEEADTMVRDPTRTEHQKTDNGDEIVEEEEEVEATVRTVSDEEDIQRSHSTGCLGFRV